MQENQFTTQYDFFGKVNQDIHIGAIAIIDTYL